MRAAVHKTTRRVICSCSHSDAATIMQNAVNAGFDAGDVEIVETDDLAALIEAGRTDEEIARDVRRERDKLLAECDWTQLPDAPLSPSVKEDYRVFRQALRDVPGQEGFPQTVTWPAGPGEE